MRFEAGNTIRWHSAAGHLVGKITKIVIAKNAADMYVPWINVKVEDQFNIICLCGSDSNIEMLKIRSV